MPSSSMVDGFKGEIRVLRPCPGGKDPEETLKTGQKWLCKAAVFCVICSSCKREPK